MDEPKLYLWYAGRKYYVDSMIISRLQNAVSDAGAGTAWFTPYEDRGQWGTNVMLLVGAGIPLVIDTDD